MVDVQEGVVVVLDKAQTSTATHARLLKTLRELHDRTDLHQFLEVFATPLRAALVVARKEPAVERVLDFAAKFAASVAPLETTAAGEEEAGDGGDKEGEEAEDEEEIKRDSGECDKSSEDGYPETEEEEEEEFDENFFNFLLVKVLSFHSASSRAVRFRSCQLVAKMLKCGAERGCWLQSCVLEAVRDVMLERIRDKISTVRVHAVQALELLQEDVSLQEELVGVLERDPSPDVRRTTLNTIVITDHTLPAILSRTRDVKDQIRKEAFWLLAEKCNIRNFRIEQRIKLLNDGLNDRSEMVREACVKGLLHSWSYNVNGDLLALLSKLDVETSPEVAEQALCQLLEEVEVERVVQSAVGLMDPANRLESWGEDEEEEEEERLKMAVTDRVLPYDLLHSVEAFYWSCVCRYLHKMGDEGDQLMEKILPTLSDFCVYVQQYVERELLPAEGVEEKVQKLFVCQQLLSMFSVVDLSDEVGRERLRKMVLDLLALPSLPLALVSPLLAQQTTLWPQPHTRVEKLLEVIADLQQPSLSTTLSTAAASGGGGGGGVPPSSSQSTTLLSEDSLMAALANLSLQDIHTDPDTLARCLMIATEMLKEQRLRKLPVNLKTMVDVLVLPSIQSELPDIRDLAFNCLGLACLHDVSLARNHLLLFLQVSQVDHESVQATAVKVVFDLLLLFGFETFSLASPGSSSKTSHQTDETLVADEEGGGVLEEVEGGEMKEIDEEEEEEEQDGEKEAKEITQRILTIMANFLDGESSVLRGIAGEGLAKLLLNGRVISQKLLVRLLILWVDPSTQEEARLRAVLGLFFPTFASSDRSCRVMVGEVFLPVMETVSEAPAESLLRDVDLNQLADYLIHLCAPREPNEDSVHDSLALSVANAVLSEPENSLLTRIYCLSLTRMQLSSSNKTELLILMDQMQRNVRDKRSLTHIKKVVQSLKNGGGGGGGEGGGGEEGEEVEREGGEVEEGEGGEADKEADGEEGREADGAADDGNLKEEEEEEREVAGEEQEELNDDTIVAPASTPPRLTSPALETTTRHKSTAKKSKVPKSTRKTKASSKKTIKKKKKKRSTFLDSSDEDSSDFSGDGEIPPQQLSALPSRVRSSRAAKMSAQKRISEFSLVVTPRSKKGQEEKESGESDDSLVGEHSPFVRQPVKRTGGGGGGRIPVLQYDDDDD